MFLFIFNIKSNQGNEKNMLLGKIINKIISIINLRKIKNCGKNCSLGKGVYGHLNNVYLGDDCHFGDNNVLFCLKAPIRIGNHFMTRPNVTFVTGDHRIDVLGKYMTEITNEEKLPENDLPIIIEDDVWIGTGSIILKGVKIC